MGWRRLGLIVSSDGYWIDPRRLSIDEYEAIWMQQRLGLVHFTGDLSGLLHHLCWQHIRVMLALHISVLNFPDVIHLCHFPTPGPN